VWVLWMLVKNITRRPFPARREIGPARAAL
jgi:hypothetical protein